MVPMFEEQNRDLASAPWLTHRNDTMKFVQLFGRLKSVVIGMIHVNALPGKHCAHLVCLMFKCKDLTTRFIELNTK